MTESSRRDHPVGLPAPAQSRALAAVANSRSAAMAAAELGISLADLAQALTAARMHYGVQSTRAALAEAYRRGHIGSHG